MKVCKIEDFPGDKIECNECQHQKNWINCEYKYCTALLVDIGTHPSDFKCPSEGKRPDCPYIECEGIIEDLQGFDGIVLYEGSTYKINDDSIKFIKACEDNQ